MIERVTRSIAAAGDVFDRERVVAEAERLLRLETPWRVAETVGDVVDGVLGLGPVQTLMDDPEITDILVNGPGEVWVDRGDGLEMTGRRFSSEAELVAVVERVIAPLGLRVDRSTPMVDARLPDGSRLHAVLPPAAVTGTHVAIRRFTQRVTSIEDLPATGTATEDEVGRLVAAVTGRETIVVSGGTGAGKTTLLNLLAAHIGAEERVVTVEDAAELSLPGHVVRLEAHPRNAEGFGEITLRQLLRSALRLRPDRIIVGEVRGPEALDLMTALNTGHRGSMTTVHANTPEEALWRLETLAMTAGLVTERVVRRQLRAGIDLVVQIERVSGRRLITALTPIEELT
ncbi:MAG: Flp pilus assembly complex ATPase component TadA [Actinobacteria bacterium]|nr:Flp pilus assembly complex ATPase component TadA [Actinomycetota bacterium]